jgi:hypothetical protein
MKRQSMLVAKVLAALLLLLTLGAPLASANGLDQTLYCTGASSTSCFNVAPSSGQYWTVESAITLGASNTFTYTLTITGDNGATGYLQDFSAQYFVGSGASVSGLQWAQNPGSWLDLSASKAGNNGSCNGSANGAFCGASDLGGTRVLLGSTAVTFGVTGTYSGTFLDSSGNWNFQLAAANNLTGTGGGNAFAISMPVSGSNGVPDGGMTLVLLGGALVGLETLRRKFRV